MKVTRGRWAIPALVLGLALGSITLPSTAAGSTAYNPTADSYVKQTSASGNFGGSNPLEVQGTTTGQRWSYLKFNVTIPAGETVSAVTLKLYFSKVQAQAVEVHATTSGWTETGITWSNKPAAGTLLASSTVAVGSKTFTLPASSVVAGDNSFVVQAPTSTSNYQFRSKEEPTVANRPVLTVTTIGGGGGTAPTVTTGTATAVGTTTATLNGTVNPNGAATTCHFDWGTTVSYGSVTANQDKGSGTTTVAVTADLTGLTAATAYHFRLSCTNATGTSNGSDATFTTGSNPPPASLLDSKALIYGSEIGAWLHDGNPAVDPATGIPAKTTAAAIPIIRFAVPDCFTDMVCGTDSHSGTVLRSDFRHAVTGITVTDGAALWLKMLPIAKDLNNGAVFCPPWTGAADGNLALYKAVLDEVKLAGYLGPIVIESNNEMEYTCWATWQAQGAPITSAGSVGVSKRIGEHYAATMPALKTYAQGLGFSQVVVGGYIGIGGGVNWGQACTVDATKPYGYACGYQARWIDEFNTAVLNAGAAPPDFESIHAYPHSPDFASSPYTFDDNIAFAYYRNWIIQSRARVNAIWGATLGTPIRFSVSEFNAGSSNSGGTWSGWTIAGQPEAFYNGWLGMLRGDGDLTSTRWWNNNVFEIASNSDTGSGKYYNLIRQDGTTPPWYDTFKTLSTTDPLR